MEHRKEYGGPRDMLDDALLQRILADMADNTDGKRTHCGCGQSGRTERMTEREDRSGSGCGCGRNEHMTERENRSGNSCGCGRNERMAEWGDKSGNGCGCGRNEHMTEREDRSGNGCGCGRNEHMTEREDRSGCGCGRNHVMPRQDVQTGGCPTQNHCVSGGNTPPLQGFPLAMVFSPHQEWEGIFEPEEALAQGTLFAGLVFPWYPSRCREGNGNGCGCGRN